MSCNIKSLFVRRHDDSIVDNDRHKRNFYAMFHTISYTVQNIQHRIYSTEYTVQNMLSVVSLTKTDEDAKPNNIHSIGKLSIASINARMSWYIRRTTTLDHIVYLYNNLLNSASVD